MRNADRGAPRTNGVGVLLLGLWLVLALACPGGEPPTKESIVPADLDRLRSLPYIGSVAVDPGESAGVVRRDPDRSQPGLTLYTIQDLARAELIDEEGQVLRSWSDEKSGRWERTELLPDGSALVIGADGERRPDRTIPDHRRYLARFDAGGALLWKHHLTAHHDAEPSRDGRFMLLTFERRRIPEVHKTIDVRDDHVTLIGEDGRVHGALSLWDAFSARADLAKLRIPRPSRLGVVPWIDVFHANSLESIHRPDLADRHPIFADGNILVCLRHQNLIAVVNWKNEELVWAWGERELLGPHDARVLDNGNLLVFDNGMGREFSRVIELDPLTERIVWEYRGSPPRAFYSLGKGSSQRLRNGNTLIAESDKGRAFEVTPDGEVVWEFLCPHETAPGRRAAIVRAIRYDRSFVESR